MLEAGDTWYSREALSRKENDRKGIQISSWLDLWTYVFHVPVPYNDIEEAKKWSKQGNL